MTDVHTREQRSRNMSAIRGKDTKPEMLVRSIVHRLGYRYRLHSRDLPGAPDLVFARLRKIINVHGCFWHMHTCRYGLVTPRTNADFWKTKRSGNVDRDRIILHKLRADGWDVLTVWECETRNAEALQRRLRAFLEALLDAEQEARPCVRG
jgi:DNA mismatch endonuclease (patch repair protein)